jgi:uncharacterized protein DUF4912
MSSFERLAPTATIPSVDAPPAAWRGRRHGEDRLHLLVRDPHRVFAAWEVSEPLARRATALAASRGAPVRYALVLERAAREGGEGREAVRVALPDALGAEGWYVDLPRGGGACRALLGLELPGGFEPLLVSRWMPVPPDEPCREVGDWPADEIRRAWLEREAERQRGRVVAPLPTSASRYLASPQAPKP